MGAYLSGKIQSNFIMVSITQKYSTENDSSHYCENSAHMCENSAFFLHTCGIACAAYRMTDIAQKIKYIVLITASEMLYHKTQDILARYLC